MIKEFICPNGRMSINGVCPLFEGDDGQIKDFNKPKTFDEKYSEIEDIEKDRQKGFFEFLYLATQHFIPSSSSSVPQETNFMLPRQRLNKISNTRNLNIFIFVYQI